MRALIGAVAFLLLPIAAAAQTGSAALTIPDEQVSRGPMTVEKVHNGFLFAPDFKFTEVDNHTSGLAGGYGGLVVADRFFIGGAAYALATDKHGRDMAYGGLLLQWFGGGNDLFAYGAKVLIGGGHTSDLQSVLLDPKHYATVRVGENFFVTEPEFNLLVHMSKNVRLAFGAGYRFTGSWYGGYGYDPYAVSYGRLSGATGSIGVQILGGS